MGSKKPLSGKLRSDKFAWEEGDLQLISRDPNPKISVVPQEIFLDKKDLPKK